MDFNYNKFRGELSDIKYISKADIPHAAKIDFEKIAEKAIFYLSNNPDPNHNYECRFSLALLKCPPLNPDFKNIEDFIDPISIGDTESRNDVAFNMMRQICKSTKGTEPQEIVHSRLRSYIRKDGIYKNICWTRGYCACIIDTNDFATLWATGMLLHSECDRYRMGYKDSLPIMQQLFEGINECAVKENGRAYFNAGGAFFNEEKIVESYRGHYPVIMSGLCEYYLSTKDQRAYDLLTEIAEGFLYDLTPSHLHQEDGSLEGHNHCQLHAIRGMAQFAYISQNPRYIEWVKTIYDFYSKWSVDTGWLPEIRNLAEHSNHSETCLNGDMLEVEIWLAMSGYTNLFDRIDRSIRNYFVPNQFVITEEYEKLYREINAQHSTDEIEAGLAFLKKLEGGFISANTPNDKIFSVKDEYNHWGSCIYKNDKIVFDMMGCCPPEGMRAIYYGWKYAIHEEADNIYINQAYNVNSSIAKVCSNLPYEGKIEIQAKKSGKYYIRIPAWAPRGHVKTILNGKEVTTRFSGACNAYVYLESIYPNDNIEVNYELIDLWQNIKVTPFEQETQEYKYHWIGNSVVEVLPKGKYMPLFNKFIY